MHLNQLRLGIYKACPLLFAGNSIRPYTPSIVNKLTQNWNCCDCNTRNVKQFSTSLITLKDKNRKKEKIKTGVPKKLDTSELETVLDIDELKANFEKELNLLKEDFMAHTSLRTTVGALEGLKIKHKNQRHTLEELARISRKAKEVILDFSANPEAIPSVLETLRSSEMRLNPRPDGHTVYVPLPKVTKEYRESLSKSAKAFCQKHCGRIKELRNINIKSIKETDGIPIDMSRRLEQTIDSLSKMYIQQAEKMLEVKQKELTSTSE